MLRKKFWTEKRNARLRVLWESDKSQKKIGKNLGCPQSMVSAQARYLHLPHRSWVSIRRQSTKALLTAKRKREFLTRFARREPMQDLAADYELDAEQLLSLARRNAYLLREICVAEGLDYPFRCQAAGERRSPRNFSRPKAEKAMNTKKRKCLSCQKAFMSNGSGNWVCGECKKTQAWRDGNDYSDMPGGHAGSFSDIGL